jgi:hypothetical protein
LGLGRIGSGGERTAAGLDWEEACLHVMETH